MKIKYPLIFIFLIMSTCRCTSQILRNDKYEMYLIYLEENEVSIAKGIYMTDRSQYYYEGIIDVISLENGESKKYNYFFSTWDDTYKEFLVKDANNESILPKIFFKDKINALIKKGENIITTKLEDTRAIEYAILSSMVVWMDNKK